MLFYSRSFVYATTVYVLDNYIIIIRNSSYTTEIILIIIIAGYNYNDCNI